MPAAATKGSRHGGEQPERQDDQGQQRGEEAEALGAGGGAGRPDGGEHDRVVVRQADRVLLVVRGHAPRSKGERRAAWTA